MSDKPNSKPAVQTENPKAKKADVRAKTPGQKISNEIKNGKKPEVKKQTENEKNKLAESLDKFGIMKALSKFLASYSKFMKSLAGKHGIDLSQLFKSKTVQKLSKTGKTNMMEEKLMKKTKMEKISKEEKEKMKTDQEQMKKGDLSVGRYMYRCLGIMPPTIPKDKEKTKDNKKETDPYTSSLLVQLRSSGFRYLYHDKAIFRGITENKSNGKREFYENDPIFFEEKDGTLTGGFIKKVLKPNTIIFQTIDTKTGNPVTRKMKADECFAAFHVKHNTNPINFPNVANKENDEKKVD